MASPKRKSRPEHVPEENIYKKTHWTLFIAFIAFLVALYMIVINL